MKKLISSIGATVLCFSLSGCIKDTTNLTVDALDRVSGTAYFGTLALPTEPSASSTPSCEPVDYEFFPSNITNLKVENVCEGGFIGKKYTFDKTPISDFNVNTKIGHGFSLNRQGTTLNLEGSYDFTTDQTKGLIQPGDEAYFSFTFATPITSTDGTLSNNNKTVTWNFTEDRVYTISASVGLPQIDSTNKPEISGTMQVGRTLEAGLRTYHASFGLDTSYEDWLYILFTRDGTFTVIWKRNGAEIPGAGNGLTYTLTPSDLNSKISVAMTYTSNLSSQNLPHSNEYQNVAPGVQTLSPVPTISGVIQVGSTVTAIPGNWDDAVAKSYVWRRNGSAISGAINSTYKLKPEDENQSLTVVVTGTKTGYVSASQSSTPVIVQPEPELPMISGLVRVGSTLRASSGDWPNGTNLAYAWNVRRCSSCGKFTFATAAYNKATFALSTNQLGYAIQVCVSDVRQMSSGLPTRCSEYTPVATTGVMSAPPVPTISGAARKGLILSVNPGKWQKGVALTYQWTKNGVAISGARGATYKISQADIGAKLNVRVTGSLLGYKSVSKVAAKDILPR